MILRKTSSLSRDAVDVSRIDNRRSACAITARVRVAHVIDENENDVRLIRLRRFRDARETAHQSAHCR